MIEKNIKIAHMCNISTFVQLDNYITQNIVIERTASCSPYMLLKTLR